jgi:CheY-like chemotaxis protein
MKLIDKHNVLKVLLAEDDEDDQLIFKEALTDLPFDIDLTIVNNGHHLFETIATNTNLTPHIIFLDLNMPKIGGIECLEKIRKNNALEKIPCFILTTSNNPLDIEQCYKLGASLYLVKPFDNNLLAKMIAKALKLDWKEYSPPKRESFFITENHIQ